MPKGRRPGAGSSPQEEAPAVYIGIDPGASGGLAWISVGEKGYTVRADPMPDSPLGILKWLVDANGNQIPRYVAVEKVGGFMASGWGEGKENMAAAHTMFSFGKNVGWIEMALAIVGFASVEEVIPRTWQGTCGVPPRKYHKVGRKVVWDETKSQFKNGLKDLCERLYPESKPTLKTADAILLAHYAKLRRNALEKVS